MFDTSTADECDKSTWLGDSSGTSSLHIASGHVGDHGKGSRKCPIRINVQQGQSIRLSLEALSPDLRPESTGRCPVYVVAQEESGTLRNLSLCEPAARLKSLYTSQGSSLRIFLHFGHSRVPPDSSYIIKAEGKASKGIWWLAFSLAVNDVTSNVIKTHRLLNPKG